jgi:hypothetical protein
VCDQATIHIWMVVSLSSNQSLGGYLCNIYLNPN